VKRDKIKLFIVVKTILYGDMWMRGNEEIYFSYIHGRIQGQNIGNIFLVYFNEKFSLRLELSAS